MSLLRPHSRCESIETSLLAQVRTLQEELNAAYDRERQLYDMLLACVNPNAALVASRLRASTPAQPMPGMVRGAGGVPRTGPQPIRERMRQAEVPGSRPLLTPEDVRRQVRTRAGEPPPDPGSQTDAAS